MLDKAELEDKNIIIVIGDDDDGSLNSPKNPPEFNQTEIQLDPVLLFDPNKSF